MKVAASSICWAHETLEGAVRKAAAAGFTAFEPLTFPSEIWDLHGDLRKVKGRDIQRLCADHGLTIVGLHLGAIMTPSEERRRVLTDYAKLAVDVAGEIGCKTIVEGGPDRGTVQPFKPFLKSLEELAAYVDGTDVRIALENHYGNWLQGIEDYEHVFDYVNHPNIGMTLDTGHFTSAEVDPQRVAEKFTAKVFHVHIKDHIGRESVELGKGATNNRGVASVLKAAGYKGYFSQELEVHDGSQADRVAAEGIGYMTKLVE